MLRIAPDETRSDGADVLRLEGDVVGRWVKELGRTCEERLASQGRRLVLDLKDVTFIDVDGIELFRELSARHVELTNCSLFVAEQLRELTPCR